MVVCCTRDVVDAAAVEALSRRGAAAATGAWVRPFSEVTPGARSRPRPGATGLDPPRRGKSRGVLASATAGAVPGRPVPPGLVPAGRPGPVVVVNSILLSGCPPGLLLPLPGLLPVPAGRPGPVVPVNSWGLVELVSGRGVAAARGARGFVSSRRRGWLPGRARFTGAAGRRGANRRARLRAASAALAFALAFANAESGVAATLGAGISISTQSQQPSARRTELTKCRDIANASTGACIFTSLQPKPAGISAPDSRASRWRRRESPRPPSRCASRACRSCNRPACRAAWGRHPPTPRRWPGR